MPGPGALRLSGDVEGRRRSYLVRSGSSTLGSSPDNDLVLPVEGVSRRHLLLRLGPSGLEIEDLGSKNGTFVGGCRVQRSNVAPGERIGVGPIELEVEELPEGDATIAIAIPEAGEVPGAVADEPDAPTIRLPSLAPAVAMRWLAAIDRALDRFDRESEPNAALARVLDELGGEAACGMELVEGTPRAVAAAGAVRETGLLEALADALRATASGGSPSSFRRVAEPLHALWIGRGGGIVSAFGIAGGFAGREQSEKLLEMLARAFAPPAGPHFTVGTRGSTLAADLRFQAGYVVAQSPAMRALYRRLAAVASTQDPLLLTGETGAGKEPLAKIVHASSPRAAGPLVVVNCAAIPHELIEAELFGVARGAASGVAERVGHFQAAAGGTLILDEIGELPLALQPKLLRVLENREIPRVGGGIERSDVRIVATTNRDLARRADEGAFRLDLYYRVATHELRVPPLRERTEDVPALVEHFLGIAARENSRRIAGITVAALELLMVYAWPGNVRELGNEVRRLVAATPEGGLIDSQAVSPGISHRGLMGGGGFAGEGPGRLTLPERLAAVERAAIESALLEAEGNRTRAAELLGIHRNSLSAKIARLGVDPRDLPKSG